MNSVRYYHLLHVKVNQEIIQRKLGPYAESRVGIARILKSTSFSIERKHLPLPLPPRNSQYKVYFKAGE